MNWPTIDNKWGFLAFVAWLIFDLGYKLRQSKSMVFMKDQQGKLSHEMNSMKDALVAAAHDQGRLQERDDELKRKGNGP